MPVLKSTIDIAADPERVFELVSDVRNEPVWNPDCLHVNLVGDGPIGLGTRYTAQWKGTPELLVECVAYEAPTSWTNVSGGPLSIRTTFTVTPTPSGCRLSNVFEIQPHGLGWLMAPLFVRSIKRVTPAHLEATRSWLESDPAEAA